MKDAIWLAGIIVLIVPGLVLWRVPLVRRLDSAARLSIAFAGGVVIASVLLCLYSLAHIPWTRTWVALPLIVIGALGVRAGFSRHRPAKAGLHTWTVIAIFAVLTLYGVATARETCGDLLYFWGPKGQRFYDARKIDTSFLGFNHYYLMHPDYPPLLPLNYAWGSLVAYRFSWWGALMVMPIALAATAAAFRGLARESIGEERAGWYAVLLSAILAYGFAIGMVGGAAEPLLLLLEVIAIAALTFHPKERDAQILAATALAGVVFIKVEGAGFVALTIVGYLIVARRPMRTFGMAAPANALLASWLLFASRHHLIDSYGLAKGGLHFEHFGRILMGTVRQASYGVAYVPWMATLAPLALRRRLQRALLPMLVAAGSVGSILFYYLHAENPAFWIESSAQRVLLTPLACLVVASAAASE